jgi:CheY-like chemotaxis protein
MANFGNSTLLRILAVEDDRNFIELLRYAMELIDERFELVTARDGLEALDMLRLAGTDGGRGLPHIVLIDLHTPRMSGKEFLAELKRHDSLRSIPAIVLSNSEDPQDVDECYRLNASAFMSKPFGIEDIMDSLRRLHAYWRHTVTLPGAE